MTQPAPHKKVFRRLIRYNGCDAGTLVARTRAAMPSSQVSSSEGHEGNAMIGSTRDDKPPPEIDPPEHAATGWRYDSFYVRLWHTVRGDRIHRIEVQHLQTGLAETAIEPAPEWLLNEIQHMLVTGIGDEQ